MSPTTTTTSGTPPEADPRVSLLVPGYPINPRGNRLFARATLNPVATPRDTWRISWRRAGMGALNGHGNARGIATAQSVLASGGAGGIRLISEAGRTRVLEQQAAGADLVLDIPLRGGMGYCLNNGIVPASGGSRVASWAGNGGSMSFVDLDRRFSFGYRWITGAHVMDRSLRLLNDDLPRPLTSSPPNGVSTESVAAIGVLDHLPGNAPGPAAGPSNAQSRDATGDDPNRHSPQSR